MNAVYVLWLRQLKRYVRSRARIVGALGQPLLFLLGLLHGQRVKVQFCSRESSKKLTDDPVVNRISRQTLAHRDLILTTQLVAEVLGATLVLHHHLVTALTAAHQAMQQGLPRARYPACTIAIILAVIVLQHGLILLELLPRDVGRILVTQAYLPL